MDKEKLITIIERQGTGATELQLYQLWRSYACPHTSDDILSLLDINNIKKVIAVKIYKNRVKKQKRDNGRVRRQICRVLGICMATTYKYIPRQTY